MNRYNLYGIGAALVDTEVEVNDSDLTQCSVDKGVMTLVDEPHQQQLIEHLHNHMITCKRASGGSAANTIIAASYFGASTFYSCKVADDENGQFYLSDLQAAGVSYPVRESRPTGITGKCLVLITPDAERSMNTFLGISESISHSELEPSAIKISDYVYLEGYLVTSDSGRAAAIDLRQQAEQADVKTAISLSDPAMVQFFKPGLLDMIGAGVDLLFCNEDEAKSFTGCETLDDAAAALKKIAKVFAITRGATGALIFDGENSLSIAPHAITAIDSNGAGDMFAGAFLFAITHGYSLQQAGDLASKASSVVVSQYGPRLRPEQHGEILKQILGEPN